MLLCAEVLACSDAYLALRDPGCSQLEKSFAGRARPVSDSSKTGPDKALPTVGGSGKIAGGSTVCGETSKACSFHQNHQ